jgi:hypothetical protein
MELPDTLSKWSSCVVNVSRRLCARQGNQRRTGKRNDSNSKDCKIDFYRRSRSSQSVSRARGEQVDVTQNGSPELEAVLACVGSSVRSNFSTISHDRSKVMHYAPPGRIPPCEASNVSKTSEASSVGEWIQRLVCISGIRAGYSVIWRRLLDACALHEGLQYLAPRRA